MFWRSYNIQLLRFYVKFRVEFIGKRIHFSVKSGVFGATFYTNKNRATTAKKNRPLQAVFMLALRTGIEPFEIIPKASK